MPELAGAKVLIVDDDIRNIFALSSVLEDYGMDIMMPEMDGITTIKEIRKLPRGKDLPIIAVTAKAMKGDRAKCIEAGAWDYLSKPVDRVHLLAVLRGWLYR